jgi:hypothetical protein
VSDQTKLTKICSDFNFRNLSDLKNFINPFYYNNDTASRSILKNKTAMTDAELNTLYDTTDPSSFGSLISTENQIIHDFHGCFEYTTKCSEAEIAG